MCIYTYTDTYVYIQKLLTRREGGDDVQKKIGNEKEIMTNTTETQKIIKDYCEQLHSNKMDNQEKVDKFPELYDLPNLNQEEADQLLELKLNH